MEGLLSKKTKLVLEKIIQHCFYINRMADRMVSVLSVKFVMPNTSNIIHKNYAHWAPVYADLISDYMDSRDCTTIYGETPRGDQEYENPLDCINKALEMNIELEKLLKKSIETSVAYLYGPGVNQVGNTIIIGHNYRNGLFFSNNKKLKVGDKIYITDNDGNKLTYTIYNKFETTPDDISFYQRDTNGKPEITLSTCTDDSSARLIIFAKAE